ncbi:MAG: PhoH family protein [Candidatus Cloacimonetes bacterium]|nr:PhoH family protein [Candidatus Cloacimonadota bacterium]MBL7107772.1 PhoH family protein [Candidatus Cloacimonadota bacterium]
MEKIYVLDTNVLIHDPRAIFAYKNARVVIPITVIEEVDTFKKGLDEKSRNARYLSRLLDNLRKKNSLSDGVKLKHGGFLQVSLAHKISDDIEDILITDVNDNLILGTAYHFQKKFPDRKVIMVSKDANVRIKADAIGLKAINYEPSTINFEELYTGIKKFETTSSKIDEFKKKTTIENNFGLKFHNQFFLAYEKGKFSNHFIGKFHKDKNIILPLKHYTGKSVWGINALNPEQKATFDILLDDNIKIVSLLGIAGTGKTLLALTAGLQKVIEEEVYTRLVVTRPIFPLGKDIGYLPGSKKEKYNPWMQPIYDNMEILLHNFEQRQQNGEKSKYRKRTTTLDEFLDYGFIELEPLTYIRGRSLPDQFIIVDEAQNLSPHEMKTIITRAGDKTKVVLTGDPYQIDIPYLDSESNGLSIVVEKFKDEKLSGHVTLIKGERSILAEMAAKYL